MAAISKARKRKTTAHQLDIISVQKMMNLSISKFGKKTTCSIVMQASLVSEKISMSANQIGNSYRQKRNKSSLMHFLNVLESYSAQSTQTRPVPAPGSIS